MLTTVPRCVGQGANLNNSRFSGLLPKGVRCIGDLRDTPCFLESPVGSGSGSCRLSAALGLTMRDCPPPWHKPNLGAQIPWPSLSVEIWNDGSLAARVRELGAAADGLRMEPPRDPAMQELPYHVNTLMARAVMEFSGSF